MKALIDTCVIIDLLQKREPFFQSAYLVFLAVANRRVQGAVTAKSLAVIYYLMHKYLHDDAKTRQALETIFKLFTVADTAGIDCKKALLSPVSDYEDALMTETGLREGADCIVTRNVKDFSKSAVPVYSPDDFLAMLERSEEI